MYIPSIPTPTNNSLAPPVSMTVTGETPPPAHQAHRHARLSVVTSIAG